MPTSPAPSRSAVAARRQTAARCSACAMRALCMPHGLADDELPPLEALIREARPVARGETLYRAGEPFRSLYAVRSGSLKTVLAYRDGRAQVTGLRIAGEPLALDAIGRDAHAGSAVALEDSSVCVVPYAPLKRLCREIGALGERLHNLMGEQLVESAGQMLLLGSMNAGERVAAFLLDVSRRNARRGYSSAEFSLRMTREDIGSYLGLTLETVSRTLSGFQKRGLIDIHGRRVRIVDADALERV